MSHGKQSEFYDEVLRALWGYVSYKLNIPVEKLSRENITENLEMHSVNISTIDKFTQALDECEFERYAPGDAAGNMNKTFNSAMTGIMEIENAINAMRKEHKNRAKEDRQSYSFIWILAFFLLTSVSASAITKQNADAEYQKGNYQQAIKDYEDLLKMVFLLRSIIIWVMLIIVRIISQSQYWLSSVLISCLLVMKILISIFSSFVVRRLTRLHL